jgi:Fe-S cluster assembly protein SufB
MLDRRLRGLKLFDRKPMPTWGADLSGIDFDNIKYFVRSTEKQAQTSWEDLPEDIKNTYDRLGIPEAEKARLVAGVAAQYESEVVYHKINEELERQGVIFLDTDTALKEHPEIFEEYFGTVIPVGDNKFAALNTAVWSGGSFVYVPKGVHVSIPLQAYFRINTENMGQFERTLIIADEDSYVHYVEGCTAPIYKSDSLHSAVVEIIVKKNARVRYTTIQNWSNNVYNLVTKRDLRGRGDDGVDRRQHRFQGHHEVPGRLHDGRARQGGDPLHRLRGRGAAPGHRLEDGALRAAHLQLDRLQVGGACRWPQPRTGAWSRCSRRPITRVQRQV